MSTFIMGIYSSLYDPFFIQSNGKGEHTGPPVNYNYHAMILLGLLIKYTTILHLLHVSAVAILTVYSFSAKAVS
jgi:hypothetical protein